MYIRTKCGIVTNAFRFATNDNGIIKLVKNGLVDSRIFFVKSQGETLIDVLEDLDQIIQVTEQIENGIVVRTYYVVYLCNGIGVDRHNEKFIRTQNSVKLYEENLLEVLENDTYKEYFKIITHEQYMKLALEVK